jgi:hypothetical protein
MIEFRQKSFSGKFRLKNIGDWAVKQVKTTNPAMLTVSGVGAGYGIANYNVNKKRKEADKELREDQIRATNELTEALKKIDGLSKQDVNKHTKNIKRAYKRADPDDEHPYITEKARRAILRKKV